MSSNAIVLAVRPQYAKKIFEGSKRVELRRIRPKQIKKGDLVLIYISSPIQSLAGAFKVDEIVEKNLLELWELVEDKAGITQKEFCEYYEGVDTGIGIFFDKVWSLPKPIKIRDLHEQGIDFQPPQGFRYATADELTSPQFAELVGGVELIVQDSLWNKNI